jgi:hypothetical protein
MEELTIGNIYHYPDRRTTSIETLSIPKLSDYHEKETKELYSTRYISKPARYLAHTEGTR